MDRGDGFPGIRINPSPPAISLKVIDTSTQGIVSTLQPGSLSLRHFSTANQLIDIFLEVIRLTTVVTSEGGCKRCDRGGKHH